MNFISNKISKAKYIIQPKLKNSISLLNPNLFRSKSFVPKDFLNYRLQYSNCDIKVSILCPLGQIANLLAASF
jgi:hypothetical protein